MSMWPDDYSLAKDGVTYSLLSAASMCPVRAALIVDRWQATATIRSTMFGSLVHELCERGYREPAPPEPAQIDKWIESFYVTNDTNVRLVMTPDEWEQLATKAYIVYCAYVEHYARDWGVDKFFTSLEDTREARWQDWRLRGKLDGVFQLKKDESCWLLETKTASRIDEDSLWSRVSFDAQCLWYLHLYELATGERLHGALYNVIRNPSHKSRASLEAALAKDPDHFFIRGEVVFTAADRAEFARDIEAQLMELDMRASGCLATYRNTAVCNKPYKCGYLNWCAARTVEGLIQTDSRFPELS